METAECLIFYWYGFGPEDPGKHWPAWFNTQNNTGLERHKFAIKK
jgi:hypothetical protein